MNINYEFKTELEDEDEEEEEEDEEDEEDEDEQRQLPSLHTKKKGVKSFCIDDILSHKTAALQRSQPSIVRPWDRLDGRSRESGDRRKSLGDSPLDALFNMASNFEALKAKSGKNSKNILFKLCIRNRH